LSPRRPLVKEPPGSKTFSRYDGLPMQHHVEEIPVIQNILAEILPEIVIELGTMYGGFAAFLADEISEYREGPTVYTYDKEFICEGLLLSDRLNLHYYKYDVLDPSIVKLITLEHLTNHREYPIVFYSDAGNRKQEALNYAPHLRTQSEDLHLQE